MPILAHSSKSQKIQVFFLIDFATILMEVPYGIKEKAGAGFNNKNTFHKVESLLLSKAG